MRKNILGLTTANHATEEEANSLGRWIQVGEELETIYKARPIYSLAPVTSSPFNSRIKEASMLITGSS